MDRASGDLAPILAGSTPAAVPGPDSMSGRLHREVILLAGWGRAILLQLAHPLVAQGVADHSRFATERWGHVRRLRRTLDAMLALTFGTEEAAARAADGVNRIHDRIHGATPTREGPFPAGTRYTAHDPALLAWVHATLLDSFLLTYELFVAPLTPTERDRYCAEASRIESLLGIPAGYLPRTHADLLSYLDTKLSGGEIAVGDTARALAREVVSPQLGWWLAPVFAVARLPAIGLLPPSIRAAYGFRWSPARERALRVLASASRLVLPLVPSLIRDWPAARRAARDSSPPPDARPTAGDRRRATGPGA
jgi:uncharacterized protein (DUF2236 family)